MGDVLSYHTAEWMPQNCKFALLSFEKTGRLKTERVWVKSEYYIVIVRVKKLPCNTVSARSIPLTGGTLQEPLVHLCLHVVVKQVEVVALRGLLQPAARLLLVLEHPVL